MLKLIFVSCTLVVLLPESVVQSARYTTVYYNKPNIQRMVEQQSLCGKNEVFDSCPPEYPPLRCNVEEVLTVCGVNPEPGSPSCEPGCRCADNYYLNGSGDCITKEECRQWPTKCTSRSPGYSECINSGCAKWRCTDYGYICTVKGPCEVGCGCKDSYIRSPAGICRPAEPCPPLQTKPTFEVMPPEPAIKHAPCRSHTEHSKSD